MADKPADFLVSVINFFGVVLPGALLTYILLVVVKSDGTLLRYFVRAPENYTLPYLEDVSQRWVAFVVVSYLLGHFASLAGAFLDSFCDRFYVLRKLFKDCDLAEKAKGVTDRQLTNLESGDLPETFARACSKQGAGRKSFAAALVGKALPKRFAERFADFASRYGGENLKAAKEVTRWANTFLRLASSEAALQLDQLEGDSKFFRSLAVVLVGCLILGVVYYPRLGFWPPALCAALVWLSLWRYANLRWKRTRLSYEFLVAADVSGKLGAARGKGSTSTGGSRQ